MKTTDHGRKLLEQREGVKLEAYKDSVGVWTIGVGHTSMAGVPTVAKGLRITAAQADEILSRDLKKFEASVTAAIARPLVDHEFDALVSLCFNIGGHAFTNSTVVKKINAGDKAGAADHFLDWSKAGGKTLQGLVNRRKSERMQFITPYA